MHVKCNMHMGPRPQIAIKIIITPILLSDIAVTEDPESTKNSTEWSPIHPSKNQCPVPEICIMGSAHRNGSSVMVGVTGSRPTGEESMSVDSSQSWLGNRAVRSSTGEDSVFVDSILS